MPREAQFSGIVAGVEETRNGEISGFVYISCMATKTISIELDAYEKLRAAKKAGESFTQVVRRAKFPDEPLTGERLAEYYSNGGSGVSAAYLDMVDAAGRNDQIPDNPWN